VQAIQMGMDLEMPGNKGVFDQEIVKAVEKLHLQMESIDKCVEWTWKLIQKFSDQAKVEMTVQSQQDPGLFY
jgi:hypothetical protein